MGFKRIIERIRTKQPSQNNAKRKEEWNIRNLSQGIIIFFLTNSLSSSLEKSSVTTNIL